MIIKIEVDKQIALVFFKLSDVEKSKLNGYEAKLSKPMKTPYFFRGMNISFFGIHRLPWVPDWKVSGGAIE